MLMGVGAWRRYSVLRAVLACEGAAEAVGERVRYVAAMVERGNSGGGGGAAQGEGGGRVAPQVAVASRTD